MREEGTQTNPESTSAYTPALYQVLARVADELLVAVSSYAGFMYLVTPDAEFIPYLTTGELNEQERALFFKNTLQPSTDLLAHVLIQNRASLLSNQANQDSRIIPSIVNQFQAEAVLAIPLISNQQIIGAVLLIRLAQAASYTQNDLHLAKAITGAMTLAVENARLYQETHNRLLESQSFHQITLALLQKLELEEVLEIVCNEARLLTHAAGSSVALLENESWLRVMYSTGEGGEVPGRFPVGQSLLGLAVRRAEPVLINNKISEQDLQSPDEPVSLLAVPLRVQGKIIGVLDAVNKPHGFIAEDVRLIQLFADQAAVAVEHARMARQLQEIAVIQDRQRLSRELHDSVNQHLYGISLYAEAAQRQLNASDPASVSQHLEQLSVSARQALSEMRLLIFELRPPILDQKGLQAAIAQRLKLVEERLGLTSAFKWRVSTNLDETTEESLYGIAQEALNNVTKHSSAHHVSIHLVQSGQTLIMKIEDDGVGFDPVKVGDGGMGFKSIQERAAGLKAQLQISSAPGQGTTVLVEVKI